MKTLHIYIAVLLLVILQSCQGCKEEIEPTPDYTPDCQAGMVWIDALGRCVDTNTYKMDPINGVWVIKSHYDDYYVTYNSGYLDMEYYYYIAFADSLYISWPQNPEQMYPNTYEGQNVNFMAQGCEGFEGPSTFLDPVRGDSLIFHAPLWNRRSYYFRFEGRFTTDRKYLEGRMQYRWDWVAIAQGWDSLMTLPQGWFPIRFEKLSK